MNQPAKDQEPDQKQGNGIAKSSSPSPIARKVNKLRRDPVQFVKDSKAYAQAHKTAYLAWAKLGSFLFVVIASLLIVGYYGLIASPRYVSEAQFMVKQADSNTASLAGLASLASVSPSMRDALVLKKYIESREMAEALDSAVSLKSHYEDSSHDAISRLAPNSTVEEYVTYYQNYVTVEHDEMSDTLHVEVQTFDPDYSLLVSEKLLDLSEQFINDLGDKMAQEQVEYAQSEVSRAHSYLKENQNKLVDFQDRFKLYNPEQQGGALLTAINNLEAEIITQQTELKSLLAFMRDDAAEVQAKRNRITALQDQLQEEKKRLTAQDKQSLNKINVDFQQIKLNTELAADLYAASLSGLEKIRSEAYRKLKHLLIIERPALAQEDKYPRRLYNIATWFICLILLYFVGRLIVSIVKEHRD